MELKIGMTFGAKFGQNLAKIWPNFGQILAKFRSKSHTYFQFHRRLLVLYTELHSFNNVAPTCLLRLPVYSVHTSCLNWMITIHRFDLGPVYKGHLVIAANFLFSVWWSLYTGMNVNDILGPVCNGHMFKAANFSFLFSGHRFDC